MLVFQAVHWRLESREVQGYCCCKSRLPPPEFDTTLPLILKSNINASRSPLGHMPAIRVLMDVDGTTPRIVLKGNSQVKPSPFGPQEETAWYGEVEPANFHEMSREL
jgi:hypothetical protein